PPVVDDFPLVPTSAPAMVMLNGNTVPATSIVDADPVTVRGFARTTTQVLNIVTGGMATTAGTPAKGVFFPNGMNGTFV
ncbi:MAG: hypothetical protein M3R43_03515, partial [Acidobacteriota bacterium]|nr:hypothetical protein [Acidobacteriota bacterium]